VPVPLEGGDRASVTSTIIAGLTSRTKLAVIDHVASGTGMIFPVEEIAAECRRRQIPILVDGAHAAGLLPVDLTRLGADFWTANMHKWICAPKASAVLHVAPQWRDIIRPLVASHGFGDGYQEAFDWTGTRDPAPMLSVPAALAFFGNAGWDAVRRHNSDLARQGAELIAEHTATSAPDLGDLAAAMRLVRLPAALAGVDRRALERRLFDEYRVVVPVMYQYEGAPLWLRVSAQLYNTLDDYKRLAHAVRELATG
jgi:isopenicillin-N epimerase